MTNKPYTWHTDLWQSLHQREVEKKMPHAILLAGEKGIGKGRFVQALVQKLLCESDDVYACDQCKGCSLFKAHSHPDIIQVGLEEKSKQIKIDQIRKIIEFNTKTSQISGRKVIVIEPAEAMNINAANALLKCLEEPTGDTLLILLTHRQGRVIPTVKSRCQILNLQKPSFQDSDQWLSAFVTEQALREQLLFIAQGNPLKALEVHEKGSLNKYKTYTEQLVSLANYQGSIVSYANDIQKAEVAVWIEFMQIMLWSLIKQHYTQQQQPLSLLGTLSYLAEKDNFPYAAYSLLESVQQAQGELQGSSNPNVTLLIESLLFRWQRFSQTL